MNIEQVKPGGGPTQDKAVEMAVGAIINRVDDVKGSLSAFVGKMEYAEALTWPSVLDSFSALSGQFSTLMKQMNNDKIPPLYRQIVLPQQVSSERDLELEKTTEGRVPVLHHEIVPDYLRTKLDLDLEARQTEMYAEASTQPTGFRDELKRYNSLLDTAIGLVEEAREDWERQSNRVDTIQSTSSEETKKLVAAYLNSTGLQHISGIRRLALMGKQPGLQQTMHPQQQLPQQQRTILSRVAPPTSIRPAPQLAPQLAPPPQTGFSTSPFKPR